MFSDRHSMGAAGPARVPGPVYRAGRTTRWRFYKPGALPALFVSAMTTMLPFVQAQTPKYPNEIRGYKVERTVVELKKPQQPNSQTNPTQSSNSTTTGDGNGAADTTADQLITFGKPLLARVTPLGITFEVPIVIAPVKQSGRIDFLAFENMVINGRSVEIDEYHRNFELPNKSPLTLREPLGIYIYLPGALLAAVGEWTDSKDSWPVTGRVYVFGKFKKGVFTFKRCVPVELNLTMRNPLKER